MEDTSEEVCDQAIFQTPQRAIIKAKLISSKKKDLTDRERIEKSRTPSGQHINTSVRDIRDFFASFTTKLSSSEKSKDYSPEQLRLLRLQGSNVRSTVRGNQSVRSLEVQTSQSELDWKVVNRTANKSVKGVKKNIRGASKHVKIRDLSNRFQSLCSYSDQSNNEESDNESCAMNLHLDLQLASEEQTPIGPINQGDSSCDSLHCEPLQAENQAQTNRMASGNIKEMNQEDEIENTIRELADSNNPQLMDIQTVIKMFGELKKEISEIKKEKKKGNQSDGVSSGESDVQQELNEYKSKTEILISIVERMGCINEDLYKRLELMEMRSMRKSIVISGLSTDGRIVQCIQQIEGFILNELELRLLSSTALNSELEQ